MEQNTNNYKIKKIFTCSSDAKITYPLVTCNILYFYICIFLGNISNIIKQEKGETNMQWGELSDLNSKFTDVFKWKRLSSSVLSQGSEIRYHSVALHFKF